jgi:excisionase family DNA binding protein
MRRIFAALLERRPVTRSGSSRNLPEFLTRREAAEILGCSVDTVDRRIREGQLKASRNGRLIRISADDLKAFIKGARRWR